MVGDPSSNSGFLPPLSRALRWRMKKSMATQKSYKSSEMVLGEIMKKYQTDAKKCKRNEAHQKRSKP
jgi:hypothetical protein